MGPSSPGGLHSCRGFVILSAAKDLRGTYGESPGILQGGAREDSPGRGKPRPYYTPAWKPIHGIGLALA